MYQHLILSRDNPRLKHIRGLSEQPGLRKKHQQTLLEGVHLLDSYLRSGLPLQQLTLVSTEEGLQHPEHEQLVLQCDRLVPECELLVVSPALYQSLTTLQHSVPLLAVIPLPQPTSEWDGGQDALILDQVQDPGNVGTLLRSAAAVGIRQVISTVGTASLWSPKVLRAAMGAHFGLQLHEGATCQAITGTFERLYATSSHEAHSLYQCDLRDTCAWILGNEGQGVQPELLAAAQAVAIPQPGGQESLNVAVAGSVCLFEMMRQRLVQ